MAGHFDVGAGSGCGHHIDVRRGEEESKQSGVSMGTGSVATLWLQAVSFCPKPEGRTSFWTKRATRCNVVADVPREYYREPSSSVGHIPNGLQM